MNKMLLLQIRHKWPLIFCKCLQKFVADFYSLLVTKKGSQNSAHATKMHKRSIMNQTQKLVNVFI